MGIALFGGLLDHLGLVEAADRRNLSPIGPGGYTGGATYITTYAGSIVKTPGAGAAPIAYRPIVDLQLAGGDFLSDVSLLGDEATQLLRGWHALPSHTTLYRFVAGADLGQVSKAMATLTPPSPLWANYGRYRPSPDEQRDPRRIDSLTAQPPFDVPSARRR